MMLKMLNRTWLFQKSTFKCNGHMLRNLNYSTVHAMKKDDQSPGSTIDKEDVTKFTNLSKTWWETDGPMKALHAMNMLRVPFVRDGLVQCDINERTPYPLKNKKILDVGCGGGILSEALAKIGAEVTGVDASEDLIKIAQLHSESNDKLKFKPTYRCTTIEDHVKDHSEYYDGVVASEVVEHVNNQEIFIKACVEALKPGGRIFFTTLNRTRMSQLFCIYVAEYVLGVVPKGTHQFEKFITPNELTFILERSNCHVEAVYGTMYNVMSNTWNFVSSQQLMYALQAQKFEKTNN